jgi:hypothetical protein
MWQLALGIYMLIGLGVGHSMYRDIEVALEKYETGTYLKEYNKEISETEDEEEIKQLQEWKEQERKATEDLVGAVEQIGHAVGGKGIIILLYVMGMLFWPAILIKRYI